MKVNIPLVLGLLLITLLAAVMLFPEHFTKINPYGMQGMISGIEGGKYTLQVAPFPPSKDHLFGTDNLGRDLYSFIIYGTRLTLGLVLLVVAGRFLLALPLGLAAGFGSQAASALTNMFSALFSTIPALIISIIVLKMNYFLSLDKAHSIMAFVIVLTIVGWGKLGISVMERVRSILASPFFLGEVAIGKGRVRLAIDNVLPHLASDLVVLFFMEIASALTILLQLGVFAAFIGNLRLIWSTDGGVIVPINVSFEPEWASVLATSRNYLHSAPWMVWAPASAFFVSILGFNLFGEGLKQLLQRRDSQFPVYVRRALSLNWRQWSLAAPGKRSFRVLAAVLATAVLIVMSVNLGHGAKPSLNLTQPAPVLSGPDNAQVIIGTKEAKQTAEDIAKAFGKMGLTPLSQGFINEYPTGQYFMPEVVDLKSTGKDGQTKSFTFDRDYSVTGFGEFNLAGEVYNATEEDLYSGRNYSDFSDKFVLFDSRYYASRQVNDSIVEKIMTESKAKGVLVVGKQGEPLPVSFGAKVYRGPVVWITPAVASYVSSVSGCTIELSLKSRKLENKGRNIIGMLAGTDKNLKKETEIIGLGYNYRAGEPGGSNKIIQGLELVKKLASQQEMRTRNIIVAFWDGTLSDDTNGLNYYMSKSLYPAQGAVLYLDLSQITGTSTDSVGVFNQWAPLTNYFAWGMGHQLETTFSQNGIPAPGLDEVNEDISLIGSTMSGQASIPTIIVATPPSREAKGKYPANKVWQVLADTIEKNNY